MSAYTHQLGFDVVTAPLAQIDRRALSQAWYSALHLARIPDARHERAPSLAPPHRQTDAALVPGHDAAAERGVAPAVHARATAAAAGVRGASEDRRNPRLPLARKIERALVQRRPEAGSASFSLSDGGGRVRVVMRVHRGRTHVVAFCTADRRDRVARALAQARFALASRGILVDDRLVECER